MKVRNTYYPILPILALFVFMAGVSFNPIQAQSFKRFVKTANKSLDRGDYTSSAYFYDYLYRKVTNPNYGERFSRKLWKKFQMDSVDLLYYHALSLWELNNYQQAETEFGQVTSLPGGDSRYHRSNFFIADSRHHQGAFQSAVNEYQDYKGDSDPQIGTSYYQTISEISIKSTQSWIDSITTLQPGDTLDAYFQEVVGLYDRLEEPDTDSLLQVYYDSTLNVFYNQCADFYHLNDDINSGSGDFGAALLEDNRLLYTTFEEPIRRRVGHPHRTRYHEIYTVLERGLIAPPVSQERMEKRMAPPATADSLARMDFTPLSYKEYHTGMVALTPNRDTMYYAQCEYIGKTFEVRCDLYRKVLRGGGWEAEGTPLNDLNISMEIDTITTEMPTWGKIDGRACLIFASNRADTTGLGLRDIWYAFPNEAGGFSSPQKLEVGSTFGDDVTPFYHWETDRLFLSTDGLRSIGGLDVYWTHQKWEDSSWVWTPLENMGMPINSTYDDTYYYLSPEGHSGLVASDRLGSILLEGGTSVCCPDLWQINYNMEINTTIDILERECGQGLVETNLSIFETDKRGNKTLVFNEFMGARTSLQWKLEYGKSYQFIAIREGFLPDSASINLMGMFPSSSNCVTDTLTQLRLTPQYFQLRVTVLDARNQNIKLDSMDLVYHQLAFSNTQDTIRTETMAHLQEDGTFLFRVPLTEMNRKVILSASDPRGYYMPSGSKEYDRSKGQFNQLIDCSNSLLDGRPRSQRCGPCALASGSPLIDPFTLESRDTLMLCPDTTAIPLYFLHDRPKWPADNYVKSNVDYKNAYKTYEKEYKSRNNALERADIQTNFLNVIPGPRIQQFRDIFKPLLTDTSRLREFFNERIKKNYERLNDRISAIANYLDEDEKVLIELAGFTSPSGDTAYNRALSKRRINSVEQYIEKSLIDRWNKEGVNGQQKYQDLVSRRRLIWDRNPQGESAVNGDMEEYMTSFANLDPNNNRAFVRALEAIGQSHPVLGRTGVLPALGRRIELHLVLLDENEEELSCEPEAGPLETRRNNNSTNLEPEEDRDPPEEIPDGSSEIERLPASDEDNTQLSNHTKQMDQGLGIPGETATYFTNGVVLIQLQVLPHDAIREEEVQEANNPK